MRFTYQSGDQPLAGYTIQRGIHRGGFGEVYFARSEGGKDVALKLLHEQDQDIEIRGVKQCLNLKHPNLVNIFDLKSDSHGDHWVVMEYVSGSSLEDILSSFPDGLPMPEVKDWLVGLVAGIAYLHDRGIVHRDLKPGNVYRENGVVKVGDVGLSKRVDSDRRRAHTQSVGTVYYMAPEVSKGQYGPEVDVYSLGVMLYELITGKLPFTGETTAEILMKHLTAQPDLTPIPKLLRPALAHALEKDPQKRTPSVRQLEQEFLRTTAAIDEHEAIPESAFIPPPIPSKRNGQTKDEKSPWINIQVNRPFPNGGNPASDRCPQWQNFDAETKKRFWAKFKSVAFGIFIFIAVVNSLRSTPFSHIRIPPFILGAVAVGFWMTRHRWMHSQSTSNQRTIPTPMPMTPAPVAAPIAAPKVIPVSAPVKSARKTSPAVVPVQPWQSRLPELLHSVGTAGLIGSLFSVGVYLALGAIDRGPVMPSTEHTILFAGTSVVGAWLVLISHFITIGAQWTSRQKWLFRLAVGIAIGSVSYLIDQFLLVDFPGAAFTVQSAFSKLGRHPLIDAHGETWLGYACFFAAWLGFSGIRELSPNRATRYSTGMVIAAVALAFGASVIFKFPQWYAMLWAGTISTTVQLASTWTPNVPSLERR